MTDRDNSTEPRPPAGVEEALRASEARCRALEAENADLRARAGAAQGELEELRRRAGDVEAQVQLRRIAESGIVGLFVWGIGGDVTEANDAFLDMLGYTRADLQAGRIDWRAMTPPRWEAADAAKVAELLATGRHGPHEKEYYTRGGRPVAVLVASAFLDEARERGVCICIDIEDRKRVEREREATLEERARMQRRLAGVLAGIGDGFVAFDRQWRYTYVNARAGELLGRAPEELVGQHAWTAFPEFAGGPSYEAHLRAAAEQRPVQIEVYDERRDRWYENRIFPSPDGVSTFFQDVTEQRRAEVALRTSAAMLRGFLDHAPVLMGVVELVDEDGTDDILHVYDNPATDRFFGAEPGSTAGRRATELGVPADVITMWARHYRAAEAAGAPAAFEYAFDTSAGARWLAVTVSVIGPGPSGRTRFTYVAEDATARKQGEVERERLLAAERSAAALREALLDAMSDGFAAFDHEWRYTYVNRQAELLLGRPSAALIGRVVWDVFPEARVGPAWDAAITALAEQRRVEYEYFLPPIGKWIQAAAYPVPGGGHAAVFRDVTAARERAQERDRLLAAERAARAEAEEARSVAEAANVAKSQFLATMSHELRTPLNAIAGHVQLLEMELHGSVTPAQRGALARVERAQRHLLSLINDVLNFAKLEAGTVEYNVQPVRVADVVRDVTPMIEPQLAARGHALTVRVPEDGGEPPLLVWADREKLAQVLLNLLGNAAKFTPDGGRIAVELTTGPSGAEDRGVAYLRVTDTGVGIPRDRQESIFDPFVQVNTSLTRRHEGTGLGLAISRDLARGMGGELRVRSIEGEGSTFTVILRRAVSATGERTDRRSREDRRTRDERRGGQDRRDRGRRA